MEKKSLITMIVTMISARRGLERMPLLSKILFFRENWKSDGKRKENLMIMIMTIISRRDLDECLVYFKKYYFSARIEN